MRRFASNALVFVLVAYALTSVVSAASSFWSVPGTLGFTTDYHATVRTVAPGGPADRAGIVAGESIRLPATPFDQRRFVAGVGTPVEPGTAVDLTVGGSGGDRALRLVAVAAPFAPAERWTLLIVVVASLIFITVGAVLIVMRPSAATWGFGLYCLLVLPATSIPLRIGSTGLALAATFFYDIVQNFGVVGLLLFTLEFPRRFDLPWRARVRRSLPAIFGVLAIMTLYPDVRNLVFGRAAQLENLMLQFAFGVVFALAVVMLCDTFRRIEIDERERVRWVLVGFCAGLVTNYVGNTLFFSSLIVADPPLWLINVLVSLNVLLPLTVAHAVVRHRVLDINFVIGRALMFAVLTTALAGVFGVMDWLFGSVLEDFRLTRVLSAVVSICVAFGFSRLEHRTLKIVEAMFFRERRAAEAHVNRSIHALPHARSVAVIENALVTDAASTLAIASAAVYRASGAGPFVRAASFGWAEHECPALDDGDPLVLVLRAEGGVVDLDALPWTRSDLPGHGREPHIAVPMLSHSDLAGFVLYGGHPDGGALDPDEVTQLERLVLAAGLAFDQLDAQRLRAENQRLSAANSELLARLDEMRRVQRL